MTDWRGSLKHYLIVTAVLNSQAIYRLDINIALALKTNKLNMVELRMVNVLTTFSAVIYCVAVGLV